MWKHSAVIGLKGTRELVYVIGDLPENKGDVFSAVYLLSMTKRDDSAVDLNGVLYKPITSWHIGWDPCKLRAFSYDPALHEYLI